jgi:glycosyltransferase involved in cell wall biosynthesis
MLLVFADDWGRHPSSCQHLVRRLLPRHRVTWVNTIGTRAPALNLATASRAWGKLRQWRGGKTARTDHPANLRVVSPFMWPWFRTRMDRWLNQKLLLRALRPLVGQSGAPSPHDHGSSHEPVVAITTIPIAADLVGALEVDAWIYYCVDDFSAWPGLDQQAMKEMERVLVDRCDAIIAASENLVERMASFGRQAELLTHGVDLAAWISEIEPSARPPAEIAESPSPRIVFWGVVDRRMNGDWLLRLADDLQHGSILLVGPQDEPHLEWLSHPRITRLPPMEYRQLPQLARLADVLVMPYADLPVTRAMQPLKLKEYLATGKPVVVSDLPAVREWSDSLDVARSAEEFSALVRQRVASGSPLEQRVARRRLERENWDAKAEEFESFVLATQRQTHRAERSNRSERVMPEAEPRHA